MVVSKDYLFFCSKTFILRSLQTKRAIPPIFWYNVNRQTDKTRNEVIAHEHYTLFIKSHQLPTQNYWSVIEFYCYCSLAMSFTLEKIILLNANYVQSTSQLKKLCKFLFQNSI